MGVGQWKEYRRCFWVAGNVLFLDLSAGSMGVFSCGKSSRGTLTICTPVWVDVWWGREEGRGRRRRISYFPSIQNILGASLVVRWLRHCAASAGGSGSIPGPGTRSQMLQLRVCMPQLKKSPHAPRRIKDAPRSNEHLVQPNKYIIKKKSARYSWIYPRLANSAATKPLSCLLALLQ